MRNSISRAWFLVFGLGLIAAPLAARADDSDPTDVGLGRRVRQMEEAREAARRPRDGVNVGLRLGEARFVRELARVDVTLEATNTNATTIEWERAFPMDPRAEVIRCSLQRGGGPELIARTLTFEDGRRLYGEASRGRQPTPTPGRDPLRVERQLPGELRVTVFPLAAGETVRVRLSFVAPLEGSGRERVYTDPLWLDAGTPERHVPPPPTTPRDAPPVTLTTLLVEPRGLTFEEALAGMQAAPVTGPRLAFRPQDSDFAGSRARVAFRAPEGLLPALSVRGGGLGTRVAVWRFDPAEFLAGHGLADLAQGTQLKLTATTGFTQRVVPGLIQVGAPPQALTARIHSDATAVTYTVEVVTAEGKQRYELAEPIERVQAEDDLLDAVTAWHRAALARHVLVWAGGDLVRMAKAVAFAVDLGVLLPGTAALAIPKDEQRLLSPDSRRTYRRDGALLGAPDGESDWIQPPAGSVR